MKILMISSLYDPHVGGVEKHVKKVSLEIIKEGHEVSVLTLRYDSNLASFETRDGINVYRFPRMTLVGIWRWLLDKRKIVKDADVVHCHDFATFFYYLPFRVIYPRKRVYITFHGFEGIVPIPPSIRYKRKIAELLTNANICVGHYITKWYGTKADVVIYGGVDLPSQSPSQSGTILEKPLDAVFVGRLEPDTGIMSYLYALQILKDKLSKEIVLHVCGDGTLHDNVAEFARDHNLKVKLHGFVDPRPFFQEAKFAFVTGYLSILEAMVENCLVFSVYDNPLKEDYLRMMPNSRLIVISAEPADLANNIARYLQDPAGVIENIRSGYQYASQQSWSAIARIYLRLWENVQAET